MAPSLEQVQRWVKAWIVELDRGGGPGGEVQVLSPHDDPRESGEVIPIRLVRHGYRMTVAFPGGTFSGTRLPEETCRTLEQVVRLPQYMEARSLRCPGE